MESVVTQDPCLEFDGHRSSYEFEGYRPLELSCPCAKFVLLLRLSLAQCLYGRSHLFLAILFSPFSEGWGVADFGVTWLQFVIGHRLQHPHCSLIYYVVFSFGFDYGVLILHLLLSCSLFLQFCDDLPDAGRLLSRLSLRLLHRLRLLHPCLVILII